MKYRIVWIILFLFAFASAKEKKYYFYHPEYDYGSEKIFNPLTVLLNGGFDVLRNGKNSKDIFDQPYARSSSHVWYNLTHPLQQINKFGWKRFISSEIFPVNNNIERMQYFPNYGNHLVGHGMKYVRLAEWYDYHKIPVPYFWAAFTSFNYAFLNEVIENGSN